MAKKTFKAKRDLYQEVTDKLIAVMEKGVNPWACPWDREGEFSLPVNFSTGAHYQGINVCLLWIEQEIRGFSGSHWMTYKQATEKGGQVRKGEEGTTIIFYKPWEKDTGEFNAQGETIKEIIPMLRSFTVFNLDQIEGIEKPESKPLTGGFNPIVAADNVLLASGVVINEGGTKAYYRPSTDQIQMPDRERWTNGAEYYATALHELTHATKHKIRCDRKAYETKVINGSYAFEELVAEIGSAFCMAWLGLEADVQNHASYLDSWLSVLKEDKRAIFRAAAQAQKAHDWIIQATENCNAEKAA